MFASRYHPYAAPAPVAQARPPRGAVTNYSIGPIRRGYAPRQSIPAPAYAQATQYAPAQQYAPAVQYAPLPQYAPATRYAQAAAPAIPRPGVRRPFRPGGLAAPAVAGGFASRGVPRPSAAPVLPRAGYGAAPAPRPTLPKANGMPSYAPPRATQPAAPAPAAQPSSASPKSILNEWLMKAGHTVPYVTVPSEGGYTSTIQLPLEGAGDAANIVGFANTKKAAEQNCAEQALQTLESFGLLQAFANKPSSSKKSKNKEKHTGQDAVDFETLKQTLLQLVASDPGKRLTSYSAMTGDGKPKRVAAALHQLAEAGALLKFEIPGSTPQNPCFGPLGYGGALEEQEPEAQNADMNEVKMVCYDLLAANPGVTAKDLNGQAAAMGHVWETKLVSHALQAMEHDGTVESFMEASIHGNVKRWQIKA